MDNGYINYGQNNLIQIFKFFFFDCIYPFRIMQVLLFLHECLSFDSLSVVPHVSFTFFKSPSDVFLRAIFGLPYFLLPGGFYLKPFLGILFCSILSTCTVTRWYYMYYKGEICYFQVLYDKLGTICAI